MKNTDKQISLCIAVINITVYLLYKINFFDNHNICHDDIVSRIQGSLVHINLTHLVMNLIGLYILSDIEKVVGSEKFIKVVLFIIGLSSIIETVLKTSCSIGFSGVLYGLLAYEMFIKKKIELDIIIVLVTLCFIPDNHSNISHSGHLIGFISGIAAYHVLS
jgi:membrane associated rhomboid family serine protease